MRRVKALADPDGLLNPGVILNDDPRAHLADLKPLPSIDPEVDTCIECGYCEPKCPTRDITLTPRQRIVVRREIARLEGERHVGPALDALRADYPWMAVESCAADGLCATACPVSIDTGALMKRLRHEAHGPTAEALSARVAERFQEVEGAVRTALRLGHVVQRWLGPGAMPALTRVASRLFGPLPQWTPQMPRPARTERPPTRPGRGIRRLLPVVPVADDGSAAGRAPVTVAQRSAGRGRRTRRTPRPRPARHRGDVLRRAVLVQGLHRRPPRRGRARDRALLELVGRGPAAHRHRHEPVYLRPALVSCASLAGGPGPVRSPAVAGRPGVPRNAHAAPGRTAGDCRRSRCTRCARPRRWGCQEPSRASRRRAPIAR